MRTLTRGRAGSMQKGCFICGNPGGFIPRYRGLIVDGRSYDIAFCPSCGLGRTDPFLDEQTLKAIYSSTNYREDDSARFFTPIEKVIGLFKVQRRKRVEELSRKGAILDIGCARADFLALMASKGWDVTGTELDERTEERGRKLGMDLRAGTLEEIRFPDRRFDAVTLWHVFEHMKDPAWAVGEIRRILKPGGLLVIAVPNIGSWQARLAARHWFHLDPPYHLYHFSAKNLKRLLENSGFEIVRERHFSLEFNPYGYVQSIYNLMGLRRNQLYDFLRSKARGPGDYLGVAISFLALPFVLPISLALSAAEAAAGAGGTVEVYARRKD